MRILLIIIVGLVLLILYVRYLEKNSLFYPEKKIEMTPDMVGLSYEDVLLKTSDNVQIHGWFVKHPSPKATMIFLHGNAGNIGDRIGVIQLYHNLGFSIFIIDYRGYGKSSGNPTEEGMYLDAQAAYDYVLTRRDVDPKTLIAFGASLGGAAAIDLAGQRDVCALILDGTFTNAKDMARRIYPMIPSIFMSLKLDSLHKIKSIHVPILIIHSVDDQTVPFAMGQKLFEAAPEPKTLVPLTGDHDGPRNEEESMTVRKAVQKLIDQCNLN